MSISITIVQRKDKINRNNTAPIHIRLTHKSKSRYVSTGITLPLDAWDDSEQHVIPTYPDADSLQMQITAKRIEIEKKIQRLEALDTEVTFDTLFGQKSKYINCTVSEYFQQQIAYMKSIGKVGTASKYETCRHLLEHCNLQPGCRTSAAGSSTKGSPRACPAHRRLAEGPRQEDVHILQAGHSGGNRHGTAVEYS